MKIKIGKYKNCQKKLKSYGFSEIEAKIICSKIAIGDTDWEVKKETEEEDPSKWETEKTPEEEEVKIKERHTPPAGAKGKKTRGNERPIRTEPKALQMPLYQPWRSYKSEHRLQTKLEKVQTAEQKFLTQEQLLKRAEYALAIKKKDADPFIVYVVPEEYWDQAIGMGKPLGTTDKGYPIVRWIRKGGASIPIVMTEQGAMTEAEAEKSGAKAGGGGGGPQISITEKLGKRAEQRITRKGEIPFSNPRTEAEVEADVDKERTKNLDLSMENLTERTLEIKSPLEQYRIQRKQREETLEREQRELRKMSPREQEEMVRIETQIKNITENPASHTIGENVQVQIDFDEYREDQLWAFLKNDLNYTARGSSDSLLGANDEYKAIGNNIGQSPYQYQEAPNHLAMYEAISRIKNKLVLYDFAYHTSNHFLKEQAMSRLQKLHPDFYKTNIGDKIDKTNKQEYNDKRATTFRTDKYNEHLDQFQAQKLQKELYLEQSYTRYFEHIYKGEEPPSITKLEKQERTKDKEFKASDPNIFQQVLEGMGLAEKGIIKKEPTATELPTFKLTGEKLASKESSEVKEHDKKLEKLTRLIKEN